MSTALRVYNVLPPAARSLAASLRGYYLNHWRYDSQTESLVEEALERDMWSDRQWEDWRTERLSFILERAATRVPFYRRAWAERRRNGDNASWADLENWEILEKESVRAHPLDFVADDCKPSRMFGDHTSGTTGSSLSLWLSKETVKRWYALFEARSRRWYGLTRNDRWAIFGGQLVTPSARKKPPFWVWNAGMKQLYMSSYHLADQTVPAYLDALQKYRIRYILGYPSAIYEVALGALASGRTDVKLEVVVTNAEPIYDHQREAIRAAFGCPIRETYGMAEIVAAGGECEHGSLHQWPEAGIIELGKDVGNGSYEFICTGLMNADMPLIRYRVGDSGSLSSRECACGRTLPVIDEICGRTDDVLYSRDGRRVGRLDPVFKGDLPIKEAQMIQESISRIVVKYVAADNFEASALAELTSRICDRLGPVEVVFERVAAIPRTSRGKFRAVICNLKGDGDDPYVYGESNENK